MPNKIITEVFFDVETKRWFSDIEERDPAQLGVSICSVYQRVLDENLKEIEGKMESFWEDTFDNMWEIFEKADRIIGFNSIGFDVPALSPYSPSHFSKLKHFDLMNEIKKTLGRRISLDALSKATLNKYKIDTGENATIYFEKKDKKSLQKLRKYCEEDVVLTKELYDFGLNNKFLNFIDKWNTKRQVEVDFSYPLQKEEHSQNTLF